MYYFICPHCSGMVEVEHNQINCKIFRHGIFKKTIPNTIVKYGNQMPPHAPKEVCDYFVENDLIFGCGKPSRVISIRPDGVLEMEICGYI